MKVVLAISFYIISECHIWTHAKDTTESSQDKGTNGQGSGFGYIYASGAGDGNQNNSRSVNQADSSGTTGRDTNLVNDFENYSSEPWVYSDLPKHQKDDSKHFNAADKEKLLQFISSKFQDIFNVIDYKFNSDPMSDDNDQVFSHRSTSEPTINQLNIGQNIPPNKLQRSKDLLTNYIYSLPPAKLHLSEYNRKNPNPPIPREKYPYQTRDAVNLYSPSLLPVVDPFLPVTSPLLSGTKQLKRIGPNSILYQEVIPLGNDKTRSSTYKTNSYLPIELRTSKLTTLNTKPINYESYPYDILNKYQQQPNLNYNSNLMYPIEEQRQYYKQVQNPFSRQKIFHNNLDLIHGLGRSSFRSDINPYEFMIQNPIIRNDLPAIDITGEYFQKFGMENVKSEDVYGGKGRELLYPNYNLYPQVTNNRINNLMQKGKIVKPRIGTPNLSENNKYNLPPPHPEYYEIVLPAIIPKDHDPDIIPVPLPSNKQQNVQNDYNMNLLNILGHLTTSSNAVQDLSSTKLLQNDNTMRLLNINDKVQVQQLPPLINMAEENLQNPQFLPNDNLMRSLNYNDQIQEPRTTFNNPPQNLLNDQPLRLLNVNEQIQVPRPLISASTQNLPNPQLLPSDHPTRILNAINRMSLPISSQNQVSNFLTNCNNIRNNNNLLIGYLNSLIEILKAELTNQSKIIRNLLGIIYNEI